MPITGSVRDWFAVLAAPAIAAQAIAYTASFLACIVTGILGTQPAQVPGITVVTVILSAFAWLAASVAADFRWKSVPSFPNLMNAVAASLAAVAGMTTIDHGWAEVVKMTARLVGVT